MEFMEWRMEFMIDHDHDTTKSSHMYFTKEHSEFSEEYSNFNSRSDPEI